MSLINSPEMISFQPLYISHFLQTFGDRLWQFAIPILFTEFYTESIFPQAIFAFATYSAVFIFMPSFGSWIDKTNRLKVVSTTIWIQNICIVISSALLGIMAAIFDQNPSIDFRLVLLFGGCLISSMIGQIMGMGATLALEKDWVVILCQNNASLLTTINGRMRRIDLFCKLLAPAMFGCFVWGIQRYDKLTADQTIQYSCILLVVWNVIGLFFEYYMIRRVYMFNPILATSALKGQEGDNDTTNKVAVSYGAVNKQENDDFDGDAGDDNISSIVDGPKPTKKKEQSLLPKKVSGSNKKKDNNITKLINGWRFYMSSQVFWCSIAYCMLYCSVLDGGTLVTAYLRFDGISYLVLGITKGIGALFGIMGTYLTPFLANKFNLSIDLIGVYTIWLFWLCLMPTGLEFIAKHWFDKSIIDDDAYLILGCMIIARCGLWAFDLAENQIMQEKVIPSVRAQVNGVQVSVSQLFFIFIAVLGMIINDSDKFWILVLATLGIILCACIIYTLWYSCDSCQKDTTDDIDNNNDNKQYNKLGVSDTDL